MGTKKTNEKATTFKKGEIIYNSIVEAKCSMSQKYMHMIAGLDGEAIQLKPDNLKGQVIYFTDMIVYDLDKTDTASGTVTKGFLIRLYDRVSKNAYYTISGGLTNALNTLLKGSGAPICNDTRLGIVLENKEFEDKQTGENQRTYTFNAVDCQEYTENPDIINNNAPTTPMIESQSTTVLFGSVEPETESKPSEPDLQDPNA